jgi:hypothetical protein
MWQPWLVYVTARDDVAGRVTHSRQVLSRIQWRIQLDEHLQMRAEEICGVDRGQEHLWAFIRDVQSLDRADRSQGYCGHLQERTKS